MIAYKRSENLIDANLEGVVDALKEIIRRVLYKIED